MSGPCHKCGLYVCVKVVMRYADVNPPFNVRTLHGSSAHYGYGRVHEHTCTRRFECNVRLLPVRGPVAPEHRMGPLGHTHLPVRRPQGTSGPAEAEAH